METWRMDNSMCTANMHWSLWKQDNHLCAAKVHWSLGKDDERRDNSLYPANMHRSLGKQDETWDNILWTVNQSCTVGICGVEGRTAWTVSMHWKHYNSLCIVNMHWSLWKHDARGDMSTTATTHPSVLADLHMSTAPPHCSGSGLETHVGGLASVSVTWLAGRECRRKEASPWWEEPWLEYCLCGVASRTKLDELASRDGPTETWLAI